MTRSVKKLTTALIYDGLCHFEFACAAEVFGLPRPEFEPDWYRFETVAAEPRPVVGKYGSRVTPDAPLVRMRQASIVIIPGWCDPGAPVPEAIIDALREAHAHGARLVSICSGSFVLAAAGLLDSRRATTHWMFAEQFQRMYPAVEVDANVLYIEEGNVMTSAGSAAGLDLCLHVVRTDYGPEIANQVARRMVIAPHRDGGQAQFVERPVPSPANNGFAMVLERMRADLASERTITQWAAQAAVSERTFIRRFREATGTTPGRWLAAARLDRARELLESTMMPIDAIAQHCGFGSAATLRHHFRTRLGIPPTSYRKRFAADRRVQIPG